MTVFSPRISLWDNKGGSLHLLCKLSPPIRIPHSNITVVHQLHRNIPFSISFPFLQLFSTRKVIFRMFGHTQTSSTTLKTFSVFLSLNLRPHLSMILTVTDATCPPRNQLFKYCSEQFTLLGFSIFHSAVRPYKQST